MAILKSHYEISVWDEKLNDDGTKSEIKGAIIGADDMSALGRATNIQLKRELKGTNTLTFQMPSMYFDSYQGKYVHNELTDMLCNEKKLKLLYRDEWYEFYVKKIAEKKNYKSVMYTYTCNDAFIEELSRNGYGITFDTELYNNVEEIGVFADTILNDNTIWSYNANNNWGDFTEYTEEKLYRVPAKLIKSLKVFKILLDIPKTELVGLKDDITIHNVYSKDYPKETRTMTLSDDKARELRFFWDNKKPKTKQQLNTTYSRGYQLLDTENNYYYLDKLLNLDENPDLDVYIPYSQLQYVYGHTEEEKAQDSTLYDATATPLSYPTNPNLLALRPYTDDPSQLIQLLIIPSKAQLTIDDGGLLTNTEYHYVATIKEWNETVEQENKDSTLTDKDEKEWNVVHLNPTNTYLTEWGKATINLAKKISITNRTEMNISEEIDRYVDIYNNYVSDYVDLWTINEDTADDNSYSTAMQNEWLCSYDTARTVVPQLSRNLIQNGVDISKTNGWEFARTVQDVKMSSPKLEAGPTEAGFNVKEDYDSKWFIRIHFYHKPEYYSDDFFVNNFVNCIRLLKSKERGIGTELYGFADGNGGINWSESSELPQGSTYFARWADIQEQCSVSGVQFGGGTKDYYVQAFNADSEKMFTSTVATTTQSGLLITIPAKGGNNSLSIDERTIMNFGLVGQKTKIEPNKFYAFRLDLEIVNDLNNIDLQLTDDSNYYKWESNNEIELEVPKPKPKPIVRPKPGKITNGDNVNNNSISIDGNTIISGSSQNTVENVGHPQLNINGQSIDISNSDNVAINIVVDGDQIYVNETPIEQDGTQQNQSVALIQKKTDIINNIVVSIGDGDINPQGFYSLNERTKYYFTYKSYYDLTHKKNGYITDNGEYYLLLSGKELYENPYIAITFPQSMNTDITYKIVRAEFFEAYTRGKDYAQSRDGDDPMPDYKYTGREFNYNVNGLSFSEFKYDGHYMGHRENIQWVSIVHRKNLLLETDVTLGDIFEYKRYFFQYLEYKENGEIKYQDTFKLKSFLNEEPENSKKEYLGLNATNYTDDDYIVKTNYLDLGRCRYYSAEINDATNGGLYDCCYNENGDNSKGTRECLYQKYGYCPYRFQTEKHPRRIRTLAQEKSNRFNLIQETSKVFEIYPMFYIEHYTNGKIKYDENNQMIKNVFFITEKGMENKLGFRYEKNLSDVSRTIDSSSITTKMYVNDVDSSLSDSGLCTIKLAEDNPSKDSFLIDYSYFIDKGLMEREQTEKDLYGTGRIQSLYIDSDTTENRKEAGFLSTLGYLNGEYDKYSNLIINMQDESYTELQANIETNFTGIEEVLKLINDGSEKIAKYKNSKKDIQQQSDTYNNAIEQLKEHYNTLAGLIEQTFAKADTEEPSNQVIDVINGENVSIPMNMMKYNWPQKDVPTHLSDTPIGFLNKVIFEQDETDSTKFNSSWKNFRKNYLDKFNYDDNFGLFGQYQSEYKQIQEWKKKRSALLKQINTVSQEYYKIYEPFLKEGTWSDSNYLSNNTYYWGAKQVLSDSCKPKITYTIKVVDLAALDEFKDIYDFNLADITYVEDAEILGINKVSGLPNRMKVMISGITYNLDEPSKNSISVQNYSSTFDDLMGNITASVQSLSMNENTYKRASNFTANQEITGSSLQGALNNNELTLVNTSEDNITIDETGQAGSDINNHTSQYKLTGEGLFFSNNGGQTWNTGVGPNGINASYIKVGELDASKVSIVDGNYLYFMWDKSGITAYRDPKTVNSQSKDAFGDYARFNKLGLSIVEGHQIKMRAGYSYIGNDENSKGDMRKELDFSAPNAANEIRPIGFYLYNDSGDVIFSTNTSTNNNLQSAVLSLQGEMRISSESKIASYNKTSIQMISQYHQTIYTLTNTNQVARLFINSSLILAPYDVAYISSLIPTGQAYPCSQLPNGQIPDVVNILSVTNYYDVGGGKNVAIINGQVCYIDLHSYPIFNMSVTENNIDGQFPKSNSSITYALLQSGNGIVYRQIQYNKRETDPTGQKTIYTHYSAAADREQRTVETIDAQQSEAVLFLNNTDLSKQYNEKRLLSIIKDIRPAGYEGIKNAGTNIFSILNNGNIYLGGTAFTNGEIMLDPAIRVEGAPFKFEEGQLKMSFNDIVNTDGNSLQSIITGIVDRAIENSAELRNLIDTAQNTADGANLSLENYVPWSEYRNFIQNTYNQHTHGIDALALDETKEPNTKIIFS